MFQLLERETHYLLTDVIEIHFLELGKLPNELEILEALPLDSVEVTKEVALSEWLLFLETDNKEVLEVLAKKNKEARQLYEAREALLHDQATWIEESYDKGREEGRG